MGSAALYRRQFLYNESFCTFCFEQHDIVTYAARNVPEAEAVGAAFLGAAFLGVSGLVSDLLANWEPTALSKKPPPATHNSLGN